MMASSFSANSGSLLTLKVRDRCGFKPCLCQMRRTLFSLRPAASAIVRVLQWVALKGLSCVVLQTTSCTLAGVMVGARPGRGASFSKPAKPILKNRFLQRAAFWLLMPISAAISRSCFPAAANKPHELVRLGGQAKTGPAPTVVRLAPGLRSIQQGVRHACDSSLDYRDAALPLLVTISAADH